MITTLANPQPITLSGGEMKTKPINPNKITKHIEYCGVRFCIPGRKWRRLKHRMLFLGFVLLGLLIAEMLFHVRGATRFIELTVAALVDVFYERLLSL